MKNFNRLYLFLYGFFSLFSFGKINMASNFINNLNNSKETALWYALGSGNPAMVQLLLSNKSDVNCGKYGIVTECIKHNISDCKFINLKEIEYIIELLIVHKADINYVSSCNQTALMRACKIENCSAKLVRLLISPIIIDHKDNCNMTALKEACGANNKEVVKTLLEHKANISGSLLNCLPFSQDGAEEIAILLLKNGAEVPAGIIRRAAYYNRYKFIRLALFLDKEANEQLNYKDSQYEDTALHTAVKKNFLRTAEILLHPILWRWEEYRGTLTIENLQLLPIFVKNMTVKLYLAIYLAEKKYKIKIPRVLKTKIIMYFVDFRYL